MFNSNKPTPEPLSLPQLPQYHTILLLDSPVLLHLLAEAALDGDDVCVGLEEGALVEAGGVDRGAQHQSGGVVQQCGVCGQTELLRAEQLVDVHHLIVVIIVVLGVVVLVGVEVVVSTRSGKREYFDEIHTV